VTFDTTRWSVVLAAGSSDSAAAREALATLCEVYWYPLYAYVRRWGINADDAQDLTQGFLASLLERRDFEGLSRERGRFRAFLLAALRHFLANDAARRRAVKHGGGAVFVPIGFDAAEQKYSVEPSSAETPETLFERRWALTVLERALAALRRESREAGREREFEALKDSMLGRAPARGYASLAADLGMSEGAVRVAVHRLRRRFQAQLKQDIRETVSDPALVEDEIRFLARALGL
jgi:RNA polymerase sigma factor (sigma-70 family)